MTTCYPRFVARGPWPSTTERRCGLHDTYWPCIHDRRDGVTQRDEEQPTITPTTVGKQGSTTPEGGSR